MPGNSAEAEPWLRHIHKVFGEEDGRHIIKWLAQRVQQPQVKINHALVLGGPQGIGKDTLLEPVKRAIGPWNFSEVQPPQRLDIAFVPKPKNKIQLRASHLLAGRLTPS